MVSNWQQISVEQLFLNLLYVGGLTVDALRQAFEELVSTERVEETDTPAGLFDQKVQPRLAILKQELGRAYGLSVENISLKIQLIQKVLDELKRSI